MESPPLPEHILNELAVVGGVHTPSPSRMAAVLSSLNTEAPMLPSIIGWHSIERRMAMIAVRMALKMHVLASLGMVVLVVLGMTLDCTRDFPPSLALLLVVLSVLALLLTCVMLVEDAYHLFDEIPQKG
jgi:hypothetical protein